MTAPFDRLQQRIVCKMAVALAGLVAGHLADREQIDTVVDHEGRPLNQL